MPLVNSLVRGLDILAAFSREGHSLTLTEITESVGLSKTTTLRLLLTLCALGYVTKDEDTKKYTPTARVLHLGSSALPEIGLRRVALPHMQALSRTYDETVSLSVLVEHEIVYLERIQTRKILQIVLAVGTRLPAYCTSMGKVLLAYLPPEQLESILEKTDFAPQGPNAVRSAAELLKDLERVRARGFSINNEELGPGLRSTAAPIWSESGRVIAAVNITVPSVRVSIEQLKSVFAPDIVKTATAISADWRLTNRIAPL